MIITLEAAGLRDDVRIFEMVALRVAIFSSASPTSAWSLRMRERRPSASLSYKVRQYFYSYMYIIAAYTIIKVTLQCPVLGVQAVNLVLKTSAIRLLFIVHHLTLFVATVRSVYVL